MKISIMMQGSSSQAGHNQEKGCSGHGNEVERQKEDELDDLTQREGRVYGGSDGFAELFDGITSRWIDHP